MMTTVTPRVRIGISSCLLGEKVRFDGGHKKDEFLTNHFGRYVEWVPVCPEFEIGLGVPREPLQLVAEGKDVRLTASRTGTDHTDRMNKWTKEHSSRLVNQELCGFVLKRSSPSCGMERVKVYSGSGMPRREGRGLFAAGLADQFPNLQWKRKVGSPTRVFGKTLYRGYFATNAGWISCRAD